MLSLDLQDNFYSFEGGCDDCHWDCAEEACGGVLRECHSCLGDCRKFVDEGFADIVSLKRIRVNSQILKKWEGPSSPEGARVVKSPGKKMSNDMTPEKTAEEVRIPKRKQQTWE